MEALPHSLSEMEFIDYVGGIVNYYGGLFSWKPDSPYIKQITGQSSNSAAISEVINSYTYSFFNCTTVIPCFVRALL